MTEFRRRVDDLRERGAGQDPDPQAELLSRLTRGWVSAGDVGPGLALLLACVIELVSAFGPVVLAAYSDATSHAGGRQENKEPEMVDYLLERIEPADMEMPLDVDTLYADYERWCAAKKRKPLGEAPFIIEFDHSHIEHGLENIQKRGDHYYGVRLADQAL